MPNLILTFHAMWKNQWKPNPPTPFPTFAQRADGREGGEVKASVLQGKRNGSEVFQIP